MNLSYVVIMAVVLQHSVCGGQKSPVLLRAAENKPSMTYLVHYPSRYNIENFYVVLINGYGLGSAMMALGSVGARSAPKFPEFDMKNAEFYNTAYRWALRAISMIPDWAAGKGSNFADTQKVWRKRFYFMENEVPDWLRSILFYVDDWDRDAWAKKRYRLYAKPSFDKHMRFSSTRAGREDFSSFGGTRETVENLDDSEAETPAPRSLYWGPPVYPLYNWYEWFGKKK